MRRLFSFEQLAQEEGCREGPAHETAYEVQT
jgi:hypothetical protein